MTLTEGNDVLSWGKLVLEQEAQSLIDSKERLDADFVRIVDLVLHCKGRVVVTGLGKSGHVGRKIVATLASTGTPALFLHAAEALHGDLGMLNQGDVLLAIAFGGETSEVINVVKFARRRDIPVVSLSGNCQSTLVTLADFKLDGFVSKEACFLNLAPTSSSTVAMALGDALAVSVMRQRGFQESNFAQYHPGGRLGFKLSLVKDHMRSKPMVIDAKTPYLSIVEAFDKDNFGIVAVIDDDGNLLGAITDGDLRRVVSKAKQDVFSLVASQVMSCSPKTISPAEPTLNAINLMEDSKITAVFVTQPSMRQKLVGLIRMHDILSAKII